MMQTKHICDRCGCELPYRRILFLRYRNKKRRVFRLRIKISDQELIAEKEFCENCKKSFWKWLENKES